MKFSENHFSSSTRMKTGKPVLSRKSVRPVGSARGEFEKEGWRVRKEWPPAFGPTSSSTPSSDDAGK